MNTFRIHNTQTASHQSADMLSAIEGMLGFVPNVFAVIAESAPALGAFVELNNRLSASSFDATEREIIQLATSAENRCTYCKVDG